MANVEFLQGDKAISVPLKEGKTIFAHLSETREITHDFFCGGKGTCRKCKVKIEEGTENISPLSDYEKKFLNEREIAGNIRFACIAKINGAAKIRTESKAEGMEIQTEGVMSEIGGFPPLKKINITLKTPALKNPVSDDMNLRECLFEAEEKNYSLPLDLIGKLTEIKKNTSEISVVVFENQILDVQPKNNASIYGVAVDIGTTTVALYLCNIASRKIVGIKAEENPQRTYGADVISRITHIMENEKGLDTLNSLILNKIAEMTSELSLKHNINSDDIYFAVFTGNTVMQHIAAKLSPVGIASAPFIASSLFNFNIRASEITNAPVMNKNALINFPPSFASYVGGDIATGIIASSADIGENVKLFLDVGTNGEIGLGNCEKMTFCATAAGPAFEGAHIKKGTAGIKGAINKVYLDGNNIKYEVIGEIAPIGICGSGIIDAVAVMLEVGAIDETGRICDDDELLEGFEHLGESFGEEDGESVFYITKAHNLYITQKDVREIQLAKASVAAGILTLLNHCGKTFNDIDEMILAGGFGAHINKGSACKIGLIPHELENKITVAGNTAGTGAVSLLFDSNAKTRTEKIIKTSNYIELSGDNYFMEQYVNMMMFEG